MTVVDSATGEVVEREDAPTLAELEEVIERGLESFVDVGNALLTIKAGKRYREAGFATFEDYCARRWSISRNYGHRLVVAAATTEALARMLPMGNIPAPTSERQVRPLTRLDSDEERADAWTEAAEEAAAEDRQPTSADVDRAVERRAPKTTVTERESFSRKVETEPPTGTSEDQGTPPAPASSDGPEVADAEAESINAGFRNAVDPDLDYRATVTRRLGDAVNLRMLDIDRAIATAGESAQGHMLSVESVHAWCEEYLATARRSRLRSVPQ